MLNIKSVGQLPVFLLRSKPLMEQRNLMRMYLLQKRMRVFQVVILCIYQLRIIQVQEQLRLKFIKKGIHINQQHLPEPIVLQPLQELIKIMIEDLKMKKKNILGIGSLFFLLSIFGCSTIPPVSTIPIEFESPIVITNVSFPEIGVETTCNVGDALVSQGKKCYEQGQGIIILKDCLLGRLSIGRGKYILVGKLTDHKIYRPVDAQITFDRNPVSGEPCLVLDTLSNQLVLSYIHSGEVYIGELNKIIPTEYFKIEQVTIETIVSKNNFQQTLIYMGKEGNTIKMSYREFLNDLARPAFTTDVSYDLDESHDITYKNAQITIISAASANITYKVLHNFR
jgi:hypothetical protein